MKKLLLTLAAGVFILALPVIASAATGFNQYSGYCAKLSFHGFQMYSSAAHGLKAKPFHWTATNPAGMAGPKNVVAQFTTTSGGQGFSVDLLINDNTWMEISNADWGYGNKNNPIATTSKGREIIANAYFYVEHVGGGMTVVNTPSGYNYNGGNPDYPYGAGINNLVNPSDTSATGTEDYEEGACTVVMTRNPTTGVLTVTLGNIGIDWVGAWTATYDSGSSSWLWNTNYNYIVGTKIIVPVIKLIPTSGIGADNAFWQ
jgi:hypothetical protein